MTTCLPSFMLFGSVFKSSLLISKEDGNCDFVVSYLLWLLLGNKEKCVVISRGSRETMYQSCS
jgi:hypothetical protein